jgi:uncharacterized protein DUF5681
MATVSWVKGQSGNPAGRPRLGESFAEKVRSKVTKHRILDKLVEVATDKTHPQQLSAIRTLLEFGYGKPVQQQQVQQETLVEIRMVDVPLPDWSRKPAQPVIDTTPPQLPPPAE